MDKTTLLYQTTKNQTCVQQRQQGFWQFKEWEKPHPPGAHWKYRKVYLIIAAKIKTITPIYREQKAPIEQMALEQDEPNELKLAHEASFILLQSLH